MPFKRTRRYRKRQRKMLRRRAYRRPRTIANNSRVYRFVRSFYVGTLSSAAVVPTFAAYSNNLTQLVNYTEFTNLFDEYKLGKITYKFIRIGSTVNESSTNTVPEFMYFVDKDDASVPTTQNEFLQSPGCRIMSAVKDHRISYYPKYAVAVFESAVTTGYSSRSGFLDCANPTIPHYGLKAYIGGSGTANQYKYIIYCTVTAYFRGVR